MGEHLGKVCPYCKTEIKDTDGVVQCGECDMPHHKDCFIENQGCTTFGCSGTMSGASPSATTLDPDHIYCSRCGTRSDIRNAYCSNCGNPLGADIRQPVQHPNAWQRQHEFAYDDRGAYQADIYHFVQKKASYYTVKFEKMKYSGSSASWNWPAFLFTFMWFAYRRMYGIAFGIIAINFLLLLMPSSILNIAVFVTSGILGNHMYFKLFEKELEKSRSMPDAQRHQYLASQGGTSAGAVWIIIIAWIVLVWITI